MKTAIYMRVSTDEQVKEGYSLAAQKRKLIAYCEAKDWTVAGIYCDEGISGSNITGRPQATQMLEDAKAGKFENILILKVDRLCRNTRDLLEIIDLLKKHNVKLNATDEQIDYTTPTGKMVLTMLGSFAELERSTISNRMMLGKEQMVKQGKYNKGPRRPYGYEFEDKKLVQVANEATNIKQWIKWLYEGKSIRWIAQNNIDTGIPTSTGSYAWEPSLVRFILKNSCLAGYTKLTRANGTVYEEKCVDIENPILTDEEFFNLQDFLGKRANKATRKFAKETFWFADVLYCSNCKHKMGTNYVKSGYETTGKYCWKWSYRCQFRYKIQNTAPRCNSRNVTQKKVETWFLEYLEQLLLPNPNLKINDEELAKIDIEISTIDKALNKFKERKKRLLTLYLDNKVNDDIYRDMTDSMIYEQRSLEEQKFSLETKKKAIVDIDNSFSESLIEIAKNILAIWSLLNDSERRLIVSRTVKKIYVDYYNGITNIEFN